MSVFTPSAGFRSDSFVLARRPVPIVVSRGSLLPVVLLGVLFALYASGAQPVLLFGAMALGSIGGGLSLIVHELGHVRAARHLRGVRPVRVSLIWIGAGTHFEGAYRSGRDQARVAVAGPVASIAFATALFVSAFMPMPRPLQYGLFGLALLNVAIGLVSLIPVYPLDGHKLLVGLVWRSCGSQRRARTLIARAGKAWLALEALGCLVLLVEKPLVGALAILAGLVLYFQKRATRSGSNLPKPAG
jgi:Zn-dependent protease